MPDVAGTRQEVIRLLQEHAWSADRYREVETVALEAIDRRLLLPWTPEAEDWMNRNINEGLDEAVA
jgi:hypothetical protein